jgi:hypothetical protein
MQEVVQLLVGGSRKITFVVLQLLSRSSGLTLAKCSLWTQYHTTIYRAVQQNIHEARRYDLPAGGKTEMAPGLKVACAARLAILHAPTPDNATSDSNQHARSELRTAGSSR